MEEREHLHDAYQAEINYLGPSVSGWERLKNLIVASKLVSMGIESELRADQKKALITTLVFGETSSLAQEQVLIDSIVTSPHSEIFASLIADAVERKALPLPAHREGILSTLLDLEKRNDADEKLAQLDRLSQIGFFPSWVFGANEEMGYERTFSVLNTDIGNGKKALDYINNSAFANFSRLLSIRLEVPLSIDAILPAITETGQVIKNGLIGVFENNQAENLWQQADYILLDIPFQEDTPINALFVSQQATDLALDFNWYMGENPTIILDISNKAYIKDRFRTFKKILERFSNKSSENVLFWEKLFWDRTGVPINEERLSEYIENDSVLNREAAKFLGNFNIDPLWQSYSDFTNFVRSTGISESGFTALNSILDELRINYPNLYLYKFSAYRDDMYEMLLEDGKKGNPFVRVAQFAISLYQQLDTNNLNIQNLLGGRTKTFLKSLIGNNPVSFNEIIQLASIPINNELLQYLKNIGWYFTSGENSNISELVKFFTLANENTLIFLKKLQWDFGYQFRPKDIEEVLRLQQVPSDKLEEVRELAENEFKNEFALLRERVFSEHILGGIFTLIHLMDNPDIHTFVNGFENRRVFFLHPEIVERIVNHYNRSLLFSTANDLGDALNVDDLPVIIFLNYSTEKFLLLLTQANPTALQEIYDLLHPPERINNLIRKSVEGIGVKKLKAEGIDDALIKILSSENPRSEFERIAKILALRFDPLLEKPANLNPDSLAFSTYPVTTVNGTLVSNLSKPDWDNFISRRVPYLSKSILRLSDLTYEGVSSVASDFTRTLKEFIVGEKVNALSRNRDFAQAHPTLSPKDIRDVYMHATNSLINFESILFSGGLFAGESLIELVRRGQNRYPLHVSMNKLTARANVQDMITSNTLVTGNLYLLFNRANTNWHNWYSFSEYHDLVFGAVPYTEITALVATDDVNASDLLDIMVKANFYIPVYSMNGQLIIDPNKFEQEQNKIPSLLEQVTNRNGIKAFFDIIRRRLEGTGIDSNLDHLNASDTRITVEEHETDVAQNFLNAFADAWNNPLLSREDMILLYLVHDFGKSEMEFSGLSQAEANRMIISLRLSDLGFNSEVINKIVAISCQDILGDLIKSQADINQIRERIVEFAQEFATEDIKSLMKILLTYYCCDASSYENVKRSIFQKRQDNAIHFNSRNWKKVSGLLASLGLNSADFSEFS